MVYASEIALLLFFSKVFHNCSCVAEASLPSMNMSAVLGQCPHKDNCDLMFKIYMVVTVIGAFISASGATPSYIVLLRYAILEILGCLL